MFASQPDRKSARLNSHPEIYALSLHDALPICESVSESARLLHRRVGLGQVSRRRSDRTGAGCLRLNQIGRAHASTPTPRSTLFPYTTLFRSVNPFPNPLACYIGAWDWGKYLGDEAIEQGVDVCVSTWNRLTANSMPAMAKSGANYMNSQLIKMEALLNGFAEGIALDDRGYVSEGSGENIFLV